MSRGNFVSTEKSMDATWFTSRRLIMRGLKPSDYFLYKSEKDCFNFDMRQLFILGLRWIYAGVHEKNMRDMIFELANTIRLEDLDKEIDRPEYKDFIKLCQGMFD